MKKPVKTIRALPTLVTLGNTFCGLLAVTYALEATMYAGQARAILNPGSGRSPKSRLG